MGRRSRVQTTIGSCVYLSRFNRIATFFGLYLAPQRYGRPSKARAAMTGRCDDTGGTMTSRASKPAKDARRTILRGLVPPLALSGIRALRRGLVRGDPQPASYYDDVYDSSSSYKEPYWQSRYFFLWSVVADRLAQANAECVLDLGCGPGQFAALLYDRGFRQYCGLDFSETSVELARRTCPTFEFAVEDLSEGRSLATREYDAVLALEFFEHVENDIGILGQVKPGTFAILTVPNFPDPAHVRYFGSADAVAARYEPIFADFRVDTFLPDRSGMKYFLLEGTRGVQQPPPVPTLAETLPAGGESDIAPF